MYNYENMKKEVFTQTGYRMINSIKNNIKYKDVFTIEEVIKGLCGDTWTMLACIDWMVENNELIYTLKEGMKQNWKLKNINHY